MRVLLLFAIASCRFRFEPVASGDSGIEGVTSGDTGELPDAEPDATLAPGACGDGDVNFGETCDDSNTAPGDGCAQNCLLEDQTPGGESCSTPKELLLVRISPTEVGALATGDTTGSSDNVNTTCSPATAPDHVFTVALPNPSELTVTVTPSAAMNPSVGLRSSLSGCGSSNGQAACINFGGPGQVESLGLLVGAGTYGVIVDTGSLGAVGPYTLRVKVKPM